MARFSTTFTWKLRMDRLRECQHLRHGRPGLLWAPAGQEEDVRLRSTRLLQGHPRVSPVGSVRLPLTQVPLLYVRSESLPAPNHGCWQPELACRWSGCPGSDASPGQHSYSPVRCGSPRQGSVPPRLRATAHHGRRRRSTSSKSPAAMPLDIVSVSNAHPGDAVDHRHPNPVAHKRGGPRTWILSSCRVAGKVAVSSFWTPWKDSSIRE